MTNYFIATTFNNSTVNVNVEFISYTKDGGWYSNTPLILSVVDIPQKVRKICADFVGGGSITLHNRDKIEDYVSLSSNGETFSFKFDVILRDGIKLLHAMIINTRREFLINWNGIDEAEYISAYMRNRHFIPVDSELTRKMLNNQKNLSDYYKFVTYANTFYSNDNFKNVKVYKIDSGMFKQELLRGKDKNYAYNKIEEVEDAVDYIVDNLDAIKNKMINNVKPRYTKDMPISEWLMLGEIIPMEGQKPVLQAAIETLKKEKAVYINAQQGIGKTSISIKTIYAYMKEKGKSGYNVLVVAPTITVKPWKSEIIKSIAKDEDVNIHIIESGKDFIKVYDPEPAKPNWYIVGKEAFKLDSTIAPAYIAKIKQINIYETETYGYRNQYKRKVAKKKTFEMCTCPSCGMPLKNELRTTDDVYLVPADFNKPKKSNQKCWKCNTGLWQSVYNKKSKTSVINYIKTKNIKFDFVIADEAHESANADSIIGNSVQTLLSNHCKKVIALSGTSNNAYSSSLHLLFMALFSQKLKADGCLEKEAFIKKYGTLQAVRKQTDGNRRLTGRTYFTESDFTEIEGINPIVFTKYMASNFIFASLSDLKENLPPINEYYIPIECDEELKKNSAKLGSDIKSASPMRAMSYENTITRHYINNPHNWESITITNGETEKIVKPFSMDNVRLEKENILVDICKKENGEGRKVWVYCDFSGGNSQYMKGESLPNKLKRILEEQGLKVFILKAAVKNTDRKEVIDANIDKYDIFISNPLLINVGINLQAVPTYIFYIPSYRVNVVAQASRRGYRANSTLENRIYHLYYKGTLEDNLIKRFERKMAEARAIESKFDVTLESDNVRTSSAFGKKLDMSLAQ